MEKELKEIIEQSKKSLEKAEEKIEVISKEFTEEGNEFWIGLKKRLSDINDKLKDASREFEGNTELQGHLAIMEARDKLEIIRESTEKFIFNVSKKMEEELDIAELKAHLAKMETEDKWEETKKELSHRYAVSKVEVEQLSKKAGKEINEIFLKLTEIV